MAQTEVAPRKIVLVVDDDENVRNLEADILKGAGYAVDQASDGASAIAQLSARRPHLLLLDLVMPGIDGWGVLEHVSGIADPPPVVVVSGQHEIVPPGHLAPWLTGYILKPFDIKLFLKSCERALDRPPLTPASGSRKDARRTFAVEATLLSEQGVPLAIGQLLDVSAHGFRVELGVPFKPGQPVRVMCPIPGHEPLTLSGHVRWRQGSTLGAEIDSLSDIDRKLLEDLMRSE